MKQLDGIEVFVKVVQTKSFSAAARSLGIPVTTASGKVASLEKRLGITLLHRTTRKLSMTSAGEAYFSHCVLALAELEAAEKKIHNEKIEPQGLLRITAPPDIGHILLPNLVRSYLRAFPKTQVELLLTNRMVDLVEEGVDIAIRPGPLKDSTLIAKRFYTLETYLFASAAYIKKYGLPQKPQDLRSHSFVNFKYFPNPLNLARGKEIAKIPVSSRLVVDDIEAAKVFILSGDGIGMLPSLICESETKNGKLVKILPDWSVNFGLTKPHISIVYPPRKYVSPKIQAFIEMAQKKDDINF